MHILPELPYDKKSLNPVITEQGFDYHHGKHHNAYVNNLNNLTLDTEMADWELKKIIRHSIIKKQMGLFNNAAQHFNHSFYWNCLSPDGGGNQLEKLLI